MHTVARRLVLIVALVPALFACGSVPARVALDPSYPPDEPTALLSLTPGTWLVALDGRQLRYRRSLDVDVPPGEHVAVFHYLDNLLQEQSFQLTSFQPVTIVWTAEAGHRYRLRAEVDGREGEARFWPWRGEVLDVTDEDEEQGPEVVATAPGTGLFRVVRTRWLPR